MHFKLTVIGVTAAVLLGCAANQAPDVAGNVRNSLKQAGLSDVTVSQDRTKGVVTLGGDVQQEEDKARAEQVAKQQAGGQVVADEIAVRPKGDESAARSIDSDLDKGIDANVDAALRETNLKNVHHSTKNGVVTLTGKVRTQALRSQAEHLAAGVPNARQVVNEIDVTSQPATSTSR
jgi:hyperosmotically inducible protein